MEDKNKAERLTVFQMEEAMELAWRTFLQFEAPDYSQEGIESFYRFIHDDILRRMMIIKEYLMWGIYEGRELIAMSGIRSRNHISLLFVDERYQRRGNATKLINAMLTYCRKSGSNFVTVNSSPYATGFYHRLGFKDLGPEETKEGIRYTPMQIEI